MQGRKKNGVANRLKAAAKANGEQRRPAEAQAAAEGARPRCATAATACYPCAMVLQIDLSNKGSRLTLPDISNII